MSYDDRPNGYYGVRFEAERQRAERAAEILVQASQALARLFGAIKAWSNRKATIAELEALDDRLLADIGLTRGTIAQVAAGLAPRDDSRRWTIKESGPAHNANELPVAA
ncbi:MAG: DUF1127 domain-containing protein [Pseudomonadota bacterium]